LRLYTDRPLQIPLLKDHHTHPLLYAAFMDGVDLGRDRVETSEQAVKLIREQAKIGKPGWTIAYGWNSGRFPLSKRDFDDLPPLVVLNISLHGLIVNDAGRAALEQADPIAAANLDDQHWLERNLRRVLNFFASDGVTPARLQRFFHWLLEEHGVYHAEEMLLVHEGEIGLFEEAGLLDRTRFWAAPDLYDRLPTVLQEKIHGIKLFTDGALGAKTAALHQPYRGSTDDGMLLYEQKDLEELLARYTAINKAVAVHAIGDRAIDQVVSAAEAAVAAKANTIRMEHVQLVAERTARRAKELGMHLSMQPNFSDDSVHYADRLPDGYRERNNPFRMLIDDVGCKPGVDLFFGSDGMPHGVREALRQSLFPAFPGQRLTLHEFVAGYCLPNIDAGHIEVQLDTEYRQVDCRIVVKN